MASNKKSYFFVFQERKTCSTPSGAESELEEKLLKAFREFKEAHPEDSVVRFLTPDEKDFEKGRALFGIHRTPAFVICDEPDKLVKAANPFISFNRPAVIIAAKGRGIIFNLITDLHYLLIDKNILRIELELAEARLMKIAETFWTELKGLLSISVKSD